MMIYLKLLIIITILQRHLSFHKHTVSFLSSLDPSAETDFLSASSKPCRMTILTSLLLRRQAFFQHTVSYHGFIVSPSSETGFLSAYRVVPRFIVSPSSETGFLSAYVLYTVFYVSPSSETFSISIA